MILIEVNKKMWNKKEEKMFVCSELRKVKRIRMNHMSSLLTPSLKHSWVFAFKEIIIYAEKRKFSRCNFNNNK